MRKFAIAKALLFLCAVLPASAAQGIYSYEMNRIDGHPESLADYNGKVLLLVNVASRCGYTPQYAGLQQLFTKYKEQGFVILGFPANNFGAQEPGTNAEIKSFCSSKYSVTFPMFAKISVSGDDAAPLYRFLTGKATDPAHAGEIQWNFTKFLISRNGKILARFEPDVTPDSPEIIQAVENALRPR